MTYGDPRLPRRFWAKVRLTDDGCWVWTACLGANGYGRFRLAARTALAHRVSYEVLVGSVPEGLDLDHLCRTRNCVRPDHLEPVTRSENIRRGVSAEVNRARGQAVTHCPQGHPYTPENTQIDGYGRRGCQTCGRARHRAYMARRRQVGTQVGAA